MPDEPNKIGAVAFLKALGFDACDINQPSNSAQIAIACCSDEHAFTTWQRQRDYEIAVIGPVSQGAERFIKAGCRKISVQGDFEPGSKRES